jgi:DNA-binding phage protein
VSAGNGLARSAAVGEATAFNTIGRALADKSNPEIGTVEAIVTIK